MTAHPDHYPHPDHRPTNSNEHAATRDDSPRVASPVPITVWRLGDRDDDQLPIEPGAGFASRLARRLVLVYTSRGQTVVDLDDDAHLRDAATTAGRSYLAVTESTRLADLDQVSQPISLVTVRWPRTVAAHHADQLPGLLAAFRHITTADASLVAAVRTDDSAAPATTFADHEHTLRAVAEDAGLTYVLQIVAISAPGAGDQFLYYATEAEAVQVAAQATTTPGGQVLHIDLLVFAPVVSRDA